MAKKRAKRSDSSRKSPQRVRFVRQDGRGRFYTDSGRPISAKRAARFKTFYDASGRRRTKSGAFAGGPSITPTRKARSRRGVKAAFKPSAPVARGKAQQKLVKKRGRRVRRAVNVRYTGKARTRQLEKLFGIKLRNRGDFASLVEAQGREIGRQEFTVLDPVGTTKERTLLKGIEKASSKLTRGMGGELIAIMVHVTAAKVSGELVEGDSTLIVRANARGEVNGGILAAVFQVLGELGLDASDGQLKEKEDAGEEVDPVAEVTVELVAYELE